MRISVSLSYRRYTIFFTYYIDDDDDIIKEERHLDTKELSFFFKQKLSLDPIAVSDHGSNFSSVSGVYQHPVLPSLAVHIRRFVCTINYFEYLNRNIKVNNTLRYY